MGTLLGVHPIVPWQKVGVSLHFLSPNPCYIMLSQLKHVPSCPTCIHLPPPECLEKCWMTGRVVNALGSRMPIEEKVDWVHFQEAGQRLVGQCARYFSSEKPIFLMLWFFWSDFSWHFSGVGQNECALHILVLLWNSPNLYSCLSWRCWVEVFKEDVELSSFEVISSDTVRNWRDWPSWVQKLMVALLPCARNRVKRRELAPWQMDRSLWLLWPYWG